MFSPITLIFIALGASAAALAGDAPCSFSMTAIGCPNGTIVEDTIGEKASGRTPLQTLAATAVTNVSSATPTSSNIAVACPTDISSGTYLFPHLIVPTSPEDPTHAFGNSFKAYISPINTTLFNFDIPSTAPYNGTCALLFLFPYASDEDPSAGTYYFSGIEEEEGEHGGLNFALLAEAANAETTYDTTGDVAEDYGTTEIIPGNNYQIATSCCHFGETVTYSISSKGNVELDYLQDSAPSPIGLYIVPCA